jgi:hypothetical protein
VYIPWKYKLRPALLPCLSQKCGTHPMKVIESSHFGSRKIILFLNFAVTPTPGRSNAAVPFRSVFERTTHTHRSPLTGRTDGTRAQRRSQRARTARRPKANGTRRALVPHRDSVSTYNVFSRTYVARATIHGSRRSTRSRSLAFVVTMHHSPHTHTLAGHRHATRPFNKFANYKLNAQKLMC